jgi:hypothetical protein
VYYLTFFNVNTNTRAMYFPPWAGREGERERERDFLDKLFCARIMNHYDADGRYVLHPTEQSKGSYLKIPSF